MKARGGSRLETVRSGMELIRWQCDEALWRAWCRSRNARVGPRSVGPLLAAGSIGGAVALSAALPFPPVWVLAGLGAVGLAGLGVADWRLRPRNALPPLRLDADHPPEISLTTTGLLVGGLALCWDAHRQRLSYAGIGGGKPLYLLFRFRVGRWLGRHQLEARLPVPKALEQDATDAAQSVRRRLSPEDNMHLFRLEARRSDPADDESSGS